nr:retrovirus-related Pol polyprotein from transposon TNT 1-94 [Tanacetum cinerariifolium]
MAAVNDVPQLVDKKGGSYAAIAPKLEPGKFNKSKKRMLCYLAGMDPYYLKCIKDDLFQPKKANGDAKPESQWTPDERRVDFQKNYDDEVDKRSSKEYLIDLDVEYQKRAMLANSKRFIKRRNNFLGQKANENTECYKCGNKGHFARDCFTKTSNPSYQSPVNNFSSVSKGFQPKFTPKLIQSSPNSNSQTNPKFQKDYKAEYKKMKAKLDEEEVSDDKEVTQVKVLMALADDELTVEKSHARNGEWVDITIRKVNTLLSIYEDVDWQNYLKYYQEMVPKTKDWVERLNPDSKLPNFNTERILVLESQAVNESLETLNTPESSKDSKAEFLTPLPPLKNLQEASPSSGILKEKAKPFLPCTHYGFNDHRPNDYRNYVCGSYDHSTLGYYRVIHIRGRVLAESSQSNESSIRFIQRINLAQHVKKGSTIELHSKLNKTSPSGSVCIFFIWICLDQKKSQAPEMIMSFIRMVENQNDVKVKQIRTNNGTEFRNHKLESSCDENNFEKRTNNGTDQMITQPTDVPLRNNNEVSRPITERLVPDVTQKIAIGSKWVFRNKKDEHGTTTKNKARLVAQGYIQEEGTDYDETFAPVARMEAIMIFLAFATYMNFIVYQMNIKSAFLNGKPKEEVYVQQPPSFESSEFPDHVYKLDKSLYGLKQAPKDDKGILIFQEQYTRNSLNKYEISDSSSVKSPMVPPNNLGPDLAGKPVNKTSYVEN